MFRRCIGVGTWIMLLIRTCSGFSTPTVQQHKNSLAIVMESKITTNKARFLNQYIDSNLTDDDDDIAATNIIGNRRQWMTRSIAATVTTLVAISSRSCTQPASASGGATAGRYTTIPIAKRRYYGRVQQAVHEFLDMGTYVVKGDMSNPIIQTFFDVNGVVVVEAKRKDVNGQCTKKNNECKGREVRDSRWNDMKASMYLLANAFRTDQQKPPDRLPTVKAARRFFKEMDEMEKLVKVKNPKKNDLAAIEKYANALNILDIYLDLVELPPTDSGHYNQEFDTLVGETARIT